MDGHGRGQADAPKEVMLLRSSPPSGRSAAAWNTGVGDHRRTQEGLEEFTQASTWRINPPKEARTISAPLTVLNPFALLLIFPMTTLAGRRAEIRKQR